MENKNICECGRETKNKKGFGGIALCQICINQYNRAKKKATSELLNNHLAEFSKLVDKHLKNQTHDKVGSENKDS